VEQELEDIEAMFVQTAAEATVEGRVLTLHDATRSTLYFSDRPERVVGHVTTEMFVDLWDEGENSFAENPPNAVLAFLEPGDDVPEDVVTVIRNPRMVGASLSTTSKCSRALCRPTRRAASRCSSTRSVGRCHRSRPPVSIAAGVAARGAGCSRRLGTLARRRLGTAPTSPRKEGRGR
jgi:hypothetical protein